MHRAVLMLCGVPLAAQIPFQIQTNALLFMPTAPTVLFAGTAQGLFRSPDNAATWVQTPILPLGSAQPAVISLTTDASGSILLAGTGVAQAKADRGRERLARRADLTNSPIVC